jgi:diamine N-acetyltransferase
MDNMGEGVNMMASKRIQLREIEEKDLEVIVAWRNDPEILRWLFSYLPLSLVKQKKWYDRYVEDDTQQIFIVEMKEGTAIGTVGLSNIDHRNQRAELGILIDKKWQKKGIGNETLLLLIEFAWNEMNLRKIKALVFEENETAIKLYKSCGFEKEGVLKEEVYNNGEFRNVLIMALFKGME